MNLSTIVLPYCDPGSIFIGTSRQACTPRPPIPAGTLDVGATLPPTYWTLPPTYWAPQLQVRPSAPPTKSWTFDPPPLHWMILAVAGGMGAVLLAMRLAKK